MSKDMETAIENALEAEFTNGMATEAETVERENGFFKVIRKCVSPDHPEILLFKAVPRNGHYIESDGFAELVSDSLGLYGDISLEPEGDKIKTIVVNSSIAQ